MKTQKYGENCVWYHRLICTRRMHLIQSALESPMSQLANARFPDIFKPFFEFLGYFEVERSTWFGQISQNILPESGYENPKIWGKLRLVS